MIEVLKALSVFFAYAVMAVFAQNAVFTRALGVSRLVKLVDDTTVDSLTFGALLCAVQLISAPLGYFVNLWLAQYPYRMYIRPLGSCAMGNSAFSLPASPSARPHPKIPAGRRSAAASGYSPAR